MTILSKTIFHIQWLNLFYISTKCFWKRSIHHFGDRDTISQVGQTNVDNITRIISQGYNIENASCNFFELWHFIVSNYARYAMRWSVNMQFGNIFNLCYGKWLLTFMQEVWRFNGANYGRYAMRSSVNIENIYCYAIPVKIILVSKMRS